MHAVINSVKTAPQLQYHNNVSFKIKQIRIKLESHKFLTMVSRKFRQLQLLGFFPLSHNTTSTQHVGNYLFLSSPHLKT